jgi:hypothetical protein
MENIRSILHRALNKCSEKQGVRFMERVVLPNETWLYIKHQVTIFLSTKEIDDDDDESTKQSLEVIEHSAQMKIRRTILGMYRASYMDKTVTELLRFEVEEDLAVL